MVNWITFREYIENTNNSSIDTFTGDNNFLSNFYSINVTLNGVTYPTVEHAYQAAKTKDLNEREVVRIQPTAGKAKRAGKKVTLRPDWELVKVHIMEDLLRQKFQDPILKQKLIETGNKTLIEGNYWGDTFWGVCNGIGENELGKLLMQIRGEINEY